MSEEPELTFKIVEPHVPYGHIPPTAEPELLGWFAGDKLDPDAHEYGPRTLMLSDLAMGEPPISEVVKVVSHEMLHFILEQEVNERASWDLDNLVYGGDFIVDRPENGPEARTFKPEYEHLGGGATAVGNKE